MVSKVLAVSALSIMLLFSGCDNKAEDRMGNQQLLDSGNFDGVISNLESKETKTDEDNLKLASAYMDRAGVSVTDLISIIVNSEDNAKTSFASFVTGVNKNKSSATFTSLQKAIGYYGELINEKGDVSSRNVMASEENEAVDTNELLLGLAHIAKVATVLSYVGDVTKLEEFGEDGNILALGCAMSKVYAPLEMPNRCASVSYKSVVAIDEVLYFPIEVILNNGGGDTYYLLADSSKNHLILTDYTTKFEETNYPVPVEGDNLTLMSALVDTLNSAFDYIISAAPDDVKEDVIYYRNEINSDMNSKISVTELTTYLNAQMAKN